MCDYSLQAIKSRPAVVGDKLVVTNFGTGTRGFAPVGGEGLTAVCCLPGTELAFGTDIKVFGWREKTGPTAIFRQINKTEPRMHHDVVEIGGIMHPLTYLEEGQVATVLQLPAKPKNKREREEQKRAEYVG